MSNAYPSHRRARPARPSRCPQWEAAWLLLAAALAGCANYRLEGMVVEGREPGLAVYGKKDAQLAEIGRFGLDQAIIEVTLDPDTGERQRLDAVRTDASGRFEVPIDVFAPGMLEYEVGLLVHRPGFRPYWQVIRLPAADKRVVVTLSPGGGASRLEIDLLRDTLRPLP